MLDKNLTDERLTYIAHSAWDSDYCTSHEAAAMAREILNYRQQLGIKLRCITSNVAWFTPGKLYTAEPEPILGGLLIMQDDLVSDFSDADAWEAKKEGSAFVIANVATFTQADT